jgi:hypothetical protein
VLSRRRPPAASSSPAARYAGKLGGERRVMRHASCVDPVDASSPLAYRR